MAISATSPAAVSNINFIEKSINKINYRTEQRKGESALIEKLICLTLSSGSYSPNEKEALIRQLTPALEPTSPKDQFNGFHSVEIELLASIAKEKGYLTNLTPEEHLSITKLLGDMQNAQRADGQNINLLEGPGYSYLSTADKIFNANSIRKFAQWIPGSFGNLLKVRCLEASVSVIAIALREMAKNISQVNSNRSALNVERQKTIVQNTIMQKFPNNSLLFAELSSQEDILDTIFSPKDRDGTTVTLTLSPTLDDLQKDLEKIIPQQQPTSAVINTQEERQVIQEIV